MNLELKKLQVELLKVTAAKGDYELKILERMEDIERIENNIKTQDLRIAELQDQINKIKN